MKKVEYAGCFGLIVYQQKVLMMLRDDKPDITSPNQWCFIGGGSNEGETYEQTFLRETQEEIGIKPAHFNFVEVFEFDYRRYGVFVANLTDEEAKVVAIGDEGQRIEFVSLEQMQSLPVAQTHHEFILQRDALMRKIAGGSELL
jgi:8-oxo-dGTP diphosphatase